MQTAHVYLHSWCKNPLTMVKQLECRGGNWEAQSADVCVCAHVCWEEWYGKRDGMAVGKHVLPEGLHQGLWQTLYRGRAVQSNAVSGKTVTLRRRWVISQLGKGNWFPAEVFHISLLMMNRVWDNRKAGQGFLESNSAPSSTHVSLGISLCQHRDKFLHAETFQQICYIISH